MKHTIYKSEKTRVIYLLLTSDSWDKLFTPILRGDDLLVMKKLVKDYREKVK